MSTKVVITSEDEWGDVARVEYETDKVTSLDYEREDTDCGRFADVVLYTRQGPAKVIFTGYPIDSQYRVFPVEESPITKAARRMQQSGVGTITEWDRLKPAEKDRWRNIALEVRHMLVNE